MTSNSIRRQYKLDDQVGFLLRCAHQRATGIFQEHMTAFGLTPTQFSALVTLWQNGEVAQNLLGRMTAMDPATIQGVMSRLADRELIESRPDEADRRKRLWRLTTVGTELISRAVSNGPGVSEETLAPLSESERQTLIGLLKRLS
jgi:DNA-binding MarR family transcriptional regulator